VQFAVDGADVGSPVPPSGCLLFLPVVLRHRRVEGVYRLSRVRNSFGEVAELKRVQPISLHPVGKSRDFEFFWGSVSYLSQ
jgi:hypothetical protein